MTDKLTGCLSASSFGSDFQAAIASADEDGGDLTLVILDIDGFARVNNEYGHQTGDAVLAEIGALLLGVESGQIYRYSGDSFAAVLSGTEKEQAFLLMEKIRESISSSGECARCSVTVSAGIATFPEDGIKHADLVRKAEGAMYRAKTTGRNKVCLAREEKLVTKTAHYTVEQLKRLKELSEESGSGEAELMREALDDLLKKYDAKKTVMRTVLIVDDAPIMRMMLKDIVVKSGLRVIGEAVDGNEAIEKYNELKPDFMFLDIIMPETNGFDALEKIEKIPGSRIIVVSAAGNKDNIVKAYGKGADGFIIKPFRAETVASYLNDPDAFALEPGDAEKLAQVTDEIAGKTKNKKFSQNEVENAVRRVKGIADETAHDEETLKNITGAVYEEFSRIYSDFFHDFKKNSQIKLDQPEIDAIVKNIKNTFKKPEK